MSADRSSPLAAARHCANCRHFDNAPGSLEAAIPGFRVMGSGYSSVRASDGLCGRHDRYLSAHYRCDDFDPPSEVVARLATEMQAGCGRNSKYWS